VCDQLAAAYLPEWQQPQEYSGYQPSPLVATAKFRGQWEGRLRDGGANMQARLTIESSDTAAFALGMNQAEKITEMRSEGEAFTGNSTGLIDSPDAMRTGAKTLGIKLLPHDSKLVGRVFATNFKNVRLPYVLALDRVSV